MKTSLSLLVFCLVLTSSHVLKADDKTPAATPASTPVLYELSKLKGADVQIKEDSQAIGGEYVMNKQAYNPVLFLDTPPGDQLTIWARIRGSSFQLKAVVGGNQQELDWVWGTAGQFVWKKFGTYSRAKLGEKFVIIRGDKAEANDGIDCVLVSPDASYAPDSDKNIEKLLAK